jgi:hypothetical protein
MQQNNGSSRPYQQQTLTCTALGYMIALDQPLHNDVVLQVFESWLHPQKFRTMMCKDGEACHREVCFFAHGAEQLRARTGGKG